MYSKNNVLWMKTGLTQTMWINIGRFRKACAHIIFSQGYNKIENVYL